MRSRSTLLSTTRLLIGIVLCGQWIATAALLPAQDSGLPTHAELLADEATLHDVQFLDATNGWAVGDRGVVRHTTNGGRTWQPQPTPVTCSLYSVCFIDAQQGWIVGGKMTPYTHTATGVVLHTNNGGQTWKRIDKGMVSRLRSVRFFDQRHGIAIGDGTSFNPSGGYETRDGGLGWQTLSGTEMKSWSAADFAADGKSGVLVGSRGASGRLVRSEIQPSASFSDRRNYNTVRMIDTANGWLAGDGGLIRTTRDGGNTWQTPPTEISATLSDWFDWQTIAANGTQAWIAGSPGSVVLHTPDAGATWHTLPTPITTPIHDLEFINANQGWAVGTFGKILATTDGGQTWQVQRHGKRRTAISVQLATPMQMPAEVVTSHAIAEGYRTVVHIPLLPEQQTLAVGEAARLSDAALHCGVSEVSTGWQLPIESGDHDLPIEALQKELSYRIDGDALAILSHSIAKHLLTYRPEIVVTPAANDSQSGLADLITKATEQAIVLASNRPMDATHLQPWQPTRHIRVGPNNGLGSKGSNRGARLSTGDFSSLLGDSPANWSRHAWSLLTDSHHVAPIAYRWHTLSDHRSGTPVSDNLRRRDMLAGLAIPRDDIARRPMANIPVGRLDQMRRIAQKRHNMERLLAVTEGNPAWAGQVVNLTGGLDANAGADLLHQLAEGYRSTGRLDLAADAYYLLARRYSESPLAEASLMWLIHYYASSEEAYTLSREAAQAKQQPKTLANIDSSLAKPRLPASQDNGTTSGLSSEARWKRAGQLADYLESTHPTLFADPQLRLTVAAAQRSRGYGNEAKRTSLLLSKQAIAEDWGRAAHAERWLSKPKGLPPEKPIAACRTTTRRPKLDGNLSDSAWQKAEPIRLRSEQAAEMEEPTAVVYFTHDAEFLYLAARVPRTESAEAIVETEPTARPRDADLRQHDRLTIQIDLDRDYQTAYELTIDHRGWTRDMLWGNRHWNPTWFVATAEDATEWCAEIAIPLSELLPPEQIDRAAWALSIDHHRPGEATTSWSTQPASSGSPDAFGLLLFQ